MSIFDVCKKDYKNEDERIYISEYLYTLVPFFFRFKRPIINLIASKLKSINYNKNDLVCRLNTPRSPSSDKIYIIYKGEVVQGTKEGSITKLGPNSVFGLLKPCDDPLAFFCATPCQILYINREEYDSIISDSIIPSKIKNSQFIRSLEFLKSWNDSK